MRRPIASTLLWCALSLSCQRGDPWAPCRESPVQFSGNAPRCATPACRACEAQLDETWRARTDPAKRTEFRIQFLRASADARDRFVDKRHPDGTFAFEHCTVGTVRGASCAMFSPVCVGFFAQALRSGDTPVAQRIQMNIAVDRACEAPRRALVEQLSSQRVRRQLPNLHLAALAVLAPTADQSERQEEFGRFIRETREPVARAIAVGHLAALAVLAPTADQAERQEEFGRFIRETREPVARAIAEALGAPDTPADLDPVVVRRGLRAYCVDLLAHSAAGIPFACGVPLARLATHPEYPREFGETWDALRAASTGASRGVIDRVLDIVATQATPATAVMQQLDGMAPIAVVEGYRRAVALPGVTPGAAAALRERLDRMGGLVAPAPAAPPVDSASCGGGPAA